MTSRNVDTAAAQAEAFNRRDLEAQVSGYAEAFRMTDHARGKTLTSRDEVKAWMGAWLQVSPDSTIEVEDVFDAGDAIPRSTRSFVGVACRGCRTWTVRRLSRSAASVSTQGSSCRRREEARAHPSRWRLAEA
jgi:SnoaL-like domain